MSKTLSMLSIFLFMLFAGKGQEANQLFDKLEFGSNDVGYRLIKAYDRARSPLKEQLTLPEDQQVGRAVPIYFWYPGVSRSSNERLTFKKYMDQWAYAWDYEIDDEDLTDEAKFNFSEYYWHFSKELIDQYFALEITTKGRINASGAQGKFPLVIFSHGHLDRWWIWGEFLASHGFAVIGTPNSGAFQKRHEMGLIGLETQIRDAEFAISVVSELEFVDTGNIITVGSSYGSLTATGLASRNRNAKGVISLDGIVADWNEGELLQRTPYWDYQQFNTPILHTHSAARYSSNYIWMDQMKYADQYRIEFPELRHEDYHFQGMTDLFGLSMSGSDLKDSSESFAWLTKYVLAFAQGVTYDSLQLNFLNRHPSENGMADSLVKTVTIKGLTHPYSATDLVSLIRKEGFRAAQEIYLEMRSKNSQPFSQLTFFDVGIMLHRLNLLEEEKAWFGYYQESYPQSGEASYRLARLEALTGNESGGRDMLKAALEVVEKDPDMTPDRRAFLSSRIEHFLN